MFMMMMMILMMIMMTKDDDDDGLIKMMVDTYKCAQGAMACKQRS